MKEIANNHYSQYQASARIIYRKSSRLGGSFFMITETTCLVEFLTKALFNQAEAVIIGSGTTKSAFGLVEKLCKC